MKQINRTKEMLIWLMLLAPFIYAFVIWNKVPERVPTHFDINGNPDDYSGKAFALLLLPLINAGIYFLLFFVPRIDPRKKHYETFGNSYQNIRLLIHVFFVGTFIFITQTTAGGTPLQLNVFLAGILLFLALLGNYMRTVRSNFFVGIRTPWTLSNDVVWRKTHQLGGRILFYSGIVLSIIVFFLPQNAAAFVMFGGVFFMIMIPVIYSYLEYRKLTGDSEAHRG
jgi:uncharacterized membrane protein